MKISPVYGVGELHLTVGVTLAILVGQVRKCTDGRIRH